jgi:signal transduction histidine kinase
MLKNNTNKIKLNVADDGVGFNVKKGKKGIGLKNITSRIEKINGSLEIKSTLGKGTEMIISVPLNNTDSKLNKKSTNNQGKALEA